VVLGSAMRAVPNRMAVGAGGHIPGRGVYANARGTSCIAHGNAQRAGQGRATHAPHCQAGCHQKARRTNVNPGAMGHASPADAVANTPQGSTHTGGAGRLPLLPPDHSLLRHTTRSCAEDQCHLLGLPLTGDQPATRHAPPGRRAGSMPRMPSERGNGSADRARRPRRPLQRHMPEMPPRRDGQSLAGYRRGLFFLYRTRLFRPSYRKICVYPANLCPMILSPTSC